MSVSLTGNDLRFSQLYAVALEGGVVVARRLMTLRLSCDHRILYGADAARFLAEIRTLLEQPFSLLL